MGGWWLTGRVLNNDSWHLNILRAGQISCSFELSMNSFIFLSSGCIPPKKVSCNNDKISKDSINGICIVIFLYRGSYMSAHVLLNLLNELGKRDKM